MKCDLDDGGLVWGFPLTKFVERVMIPEAALLLIQDDFGLDLAVPADRKLAIDLKDDSTPYGNKKYPYEDDNNSTAGSDDA
jgi:hypothetical protein